MWRPALFQHGLKSSSTITLTLLPDDEIKKLKKLIEDLNTTNNKDLEQHIAACDHQIALGPNMLRLLQDKKNTLEEHIKIMRKELEDQKLKKNS